jgi:hypothetical protein
VDGGDKVKNEKHIRLTLDFTVTIKDDIPNPGLKWASAKSQAFKDLFKILLMDQEVLKKVLAVQVADELANIADHELLPDWIYGGEDLFLQLSPAIAQLSIEEQEEFHAGRDDGIECEFADYCFSTNLTHAEIAICECEVEG